MIKGALDKEEIVFHPSYFYEENGKTVFIDLFVEFPIPAETPYVPCVIRNEAGEITLMNSFHRSELVRTAKKAYELLQEKELVA